MLPISNLLTVGVDVGVALQLVVVRLPDWRRDILRSMIGTALQRTMLLLLYLPVLVAVRLAIALCHGRAVC